MTVPASAKIPVLIVRVGARACAIPLEHVAETMRPLPIEAVAGTPDFVRGMSMIRGVPTPVVDLGALLENGASSSGFGRFVTVKLGERRLAVGVDAVHGVRDLDSAELGAVPPILRDNASDLIEAIGTRDAQLLVVLRAACILPQEVWTLLEAAEETR